MEDPMENGQFIDGLPNLKTGGFSIVMQQFTRG